MTNFIKSLALSKHCNSWALNAFKNDCTKMGAKPFSKAVGFGHLPPNSYENPALTVYTQKAYIQ